MPYVPGDLRPGDCILTIGKRGLSSPSEWLTDGIDWATDCPFDHCVMVGDGEIIEQLSTMTVSPLDKYQHNGWRFTIPSTPEQTAAAIAWMKARVGAPYGVAELLEDAGRDILHLPLWPPKHPKADARYTCSGSFVMAYLQAGFWVTHAPWASPADIAFSGVPVGQRPWEGSGAA